MMSPVEDEEIERAIRRDPRPLIVAAVGIVGALVLIGAGLVAFGELDLGRRAARGFATVTDSPAPRPATEP